MTDDERAIRQLVETWIAASRAGDTATVLSLMAEDAVFLVTGQEPFGKEAFAAAASAMQGIRIDGKSDVQEVRVLGDWAYMRTRLEVSATPTAGAPVRRAGHTLSILRREADGQWRLVRDANLLAPLA